MAIDFSKLAEPFEASEVEWRVSRAGKGRNGIFCVVLAYVTARAIAQRFDDVCGPEGWRNEKPEIIEVRPGVTAFIGGISVIDNQGEWITKYDVASPTDIEPAKGGFSGAMKRAAAQFGAGRYLYLLDEEFAEVSDNPPSKKGWNYATLSERHGSDSYYWRPPRLPSWALPKDSDQGITQAELNALKKAWKEKFAADIKNPGELREGFERFVASVCGEFPVSDYTCWIRESFEKCQEQISATTDASDIAADVPFDSQ